MKEKLFKFFDAIPVLLSLKNPERWSWMMKAIFTEEQKKNLYLNKVLFWILLGEILLFILNY